MCHHYHIFISQVKRTDNEIFKIVGKIDECEKEVTDMACDEESQENKVSYLLCFVIF